MTQTKTAKNHTGASVAYTAEAEFMVKSEILQGQIRTETVRQLKADLRGQTAKANRAETRADRQEVKAKTEQVKLAIDQTNLRGNQALAALNERRWVASLTSTAYRVDATEALNKGRQQFLSNAGISPTQVSLPSAKGVKA